MENTLDRPRTSNAAKRINWARSLSNKDITVILQEKLMDARSNSGKHVDLLTELAHEIKHRLTVTKYNGAPTNNSRDDDYDDEDDDDDGD
jgi:hypothetical protein